MSTSYQLKLRDRIRNCEDALLVEAHGLALVTCGPGERRGTPSWYDESPPFIAGRSLAYCGATLPTVPTPTPLCPTRSPSCTLRPSGFTRSSARSASNSTSLPPRYSSPTTSARACALNSSASTSRP
ncbi:hypothetical protein F5X96DRAFT_620738 [Biscogniauxia mediterranea]|nr:hypothetical protein F5X96DRAFT_620738 [Biscogniauxia mediterranea]